MQFDYAEPVEEEGVGEDVEEMIVEPSGEEAESGDAGEVRDDVLPAAEEEVLEPEDEDEAQSVIERLKRSGMATNGISKKPRREEQGE